MHDPEHPLRRLRQHQVGRLQQHLGVGRLDQFAQAMGGGADRIFALVLAGKVGDVGHLADRKGRGSQRFDPARLPGFAQHAGHALRIAVPGLGQRRHAGLEQAGADVVQQVRRHAARIVPEGIEVGRHLARDGTGDQHVAVAEVVFGIPVVIVVLVVAPAGDPDHAIDHQQLGVHALVELAPAAGGGEQVLHVAKARAVEHRVVDADGEVGVRTGQRSEGVDPLQRRQLVDQQAHMHAAARGGQQFVEEQHARIVLVEDVGLQVDAGGGAAQQADAREHRVLALVEDQCAVPRRAGRAFDHGACAELVQRRRRGAGVDAFAGDFMRACALDQRGGTRLFLRRQRRACSGTGREQQRQRAQPGSHCSCSSRIRSEKPTWSPTAMRQRCMP